MLESEFVVVPGWRRQRFIIGSAHRRSRSVCLLPCLLTDPHLLYYNDWCFHCSLCSALCHWQVCMFMCMCCKFLYSLYNCIRTGMKGINYSNVKFQLNIEGEILFDNFRQQKIIMVRYWVIMRETIQDINCITCLNMHSNAINKCAKQWASDLHLAIDESEKKCPFKLS